MKTNRSSWMKGLVLALLAAALSPGLVNAADSAQGKFTLPMAVQWGKAELPAGDYTFTLASAGLPAMVTVRSETKGSTGAMVFAHAYNPASSSDGSSLTIGRSGDRGFISSMHLAELGITFYYAPPKQDRELLAQGPELIQRVAISTGIATGK